MAGATLLMLLEVPCEADVAQSTSNTRHTSTDISAACNMKSSAAAAGPSVVLHGPVCMQLIVCNVM
jgi:hypothetical protein